MLPFELVRIWCRLPLSGSTIAQDIVDAIEAAKDPCMSMLDCPWNHHGHDRYFRARRVVWRLAFRSYRERGEVAFITFTERKAA